MASQSITPADRIRELSAINAQIPKLLELAGQAINTLTNRPLQASEDGEGDAHMTNGERKDTLDARKQTFEQLAIQFDTGVRDLQVPLRRQVYALEEAGIIAAEAPSLSVGTQLSTAAAGMAGRGQATVAAQAPERITNGGLGNLDVGLLNSRGNKVGAEKEAELLEEAKELLQTTLDRSK